MPTRMLRDDSGREVVIWLLPALGTTIIGWITIKNLLDARGIDLDLEAAAFELEQLG